MTREIAILCDPHWGVRNHSPIFQQYFEDFCENVFFPTLKQRNIQHLIILGDLWDNRKVVNINILHRTRKSFLDPLHESGIVTHCLVGNHDAYFREQLEVNSVRELTARYPRFHVVDTPLEITVEGLSLLLLPWINESNRDLCVQAVTDSDATVLMGHLELIGFPVYRGFISESGMDKAMFAKFKKVFSGHFHTQSQNGSIYYLGSAAEHTFQDADEAKGFHIMNLLTLDTEFIANPKKLHHHLEYDDTNMDSIDDSIADLSQYSGCFLKIHVMHKNNAALFEEWLDRLQAVNPASVAVIEDFSLPSNDVEPIGTDLSRETTASILSQYVDTIPDLNADPTQLKAVLHDLYTEAIRVSDE